MNKFGFWCKKNSPQILVGVGVATLVADIAVTAWQSTKVNDVLKPNRERLEQLKKDKKNEDLIEAGEIDIKYINSEIRKEYRDIFLKLGKLYWPTLALTTVSVSSFLGSNHILKKREIAASAALAASQTAFASYRDLVKKELGDSKEKEIYIENEVNKDETDPSKALDCTNKTYDFIYDMGDAFWETNVSENLMTIYGIEKMLNRRLRAEGHLFLVDVYKEFGITSTKLSRWQLQAAHTVGWLYDHTKGIEDYISFGLHVPESGGKLTEYGMKVREEETPTILIELHPRGDILTGDRGYITFMDTVSEVGV